VVARGQLRGCPSIAKRVGRSSNVSFVPGRAPHGIPGCTRSCERCLDRLGGRVGDLQADLEWRLPVAIAIERARSHEVPRRAADSGLLVNG